MRPVGAPVLCLGIAFFFFSVAVSNLSDPFHQRNPENLTLEFGFALFCLLGAFLIYNVRVTLHNGVVEETIGPFWRRTHQLSELTLLKASPSGSGKVMSFSSGRSVGILYIYSGQPYFLESLRREVHRLGVKVDGL